MSKIVMKTKFLNSSLFLTVFALFGVGLVQVYSSSYIYATEGFGDAHFFFRRQLFFTLVAFCTLVLFTQVPLGLLKKYAPLIFIATVAALLLTFIPGIGVRVGGAQRWIQLPFGSRFEPSEVLKLSYSLLIAGMIARRETIFRNVKIGWQLILFFIPLFFLLKQPDFGSTVIIMLVSISLIYVLGVSLKWLSLGFLSLLPVLYFLVWKVPYRQARLQTFLDPWSDPEQKGFQVIQSMLSIHSGGLTGQGLGQGQGKLFFLPEAHTDFTMAVLGEELGFIGIVVLILVYGFLIFRGFQISMQTQDKFKKYLALGLILSFAFSVFINIGVVTGLLPTKGLTMPFLSYGGSSLLAQSILFGLLINIEISENAT
jgi:cell division protein FtsW